MVKEVLTYPKNKDILTQKSETVENIDDSILAIIQDMKDTLHNTKEGVGTVSYTHLTLPTTSRV